MGVVYLAYHRGLQREVALKIIKPTRQGAEFVARFRAEAAALGRLRHPHIVDVTDFGVDPRSPGMPYLVMEYLSGMTLDRALLSGAMAMADALPVLASIARAVDFAHEHGILHRDIKPENVFLSQSGDRRSVKVLDFGVAHIGRTPGKDDRPLLNEDERTRPVAMPAGTESTSLDQITTCAGPVSHDQETSPGCLFITTPGEIVGTVPYLAPELLAGDVATKASDVYAFGVLAYQVAVGRRPNTITSLEGASYTPPPAAHSLNPTLSDNISRVLAWPLSRYAADRPESAHRFVDTLRQAHHRSLVESWKRFELPRRRRLSAVLALLVCAAAWRAEVHPWVASVEAWITDVRFRLAPQRAPDPRIIVVLVDDASVTETADLLGERADEFAERFEQIFAAGASGIAVDLLLPGRWGNSQRFSRLVLSRADQLTLAAMSGAAGQVVGPECVAGLTAVALGPERTSNLFGFVNIEPDVDGVIRFARLSFIDTTGMPRDSFARRSILAAFGNAVSDKTALGSKREREDSIFPIDARVDPARFPTVPWSRLPHELSASPSVFRNRLVLVGASFVGSGDLHRFPNRGLIPGVFVQAVLMNTILSGLPIVEMDSIVWLPLLLLLSWTVAVQGMTRKTPGTVAAVLAAVGGWAFGSFTLFAIAGNTLPVLVPVMTVVVAALAAVVTRRFLEPYPQPQAVP